VLCVIYYVLQRDFFVVSLATISSAFLVYLSTVQIGRLLPAGELIEVLLSVSVLFAAVGIAFLAVKNGGGRAAKYSLYALAAIVLACGLASLILPATGTDPREYLVLMLGALIAVFVADGIYYTLKMIR
jgi:hypothetical protein